MVFNTEDDTPIRKYVRRKIPIKGDSSDYHIKYYHEVLAKKNAKQAEFNTRQRDNLTKLKKRKIRLEGDAYRRRAIIIREQKIIAKKLGTIRKIEKGLARIQSLQDANERNIIKQTRIVRKLKVVNPYHKNVKKNVDN
jgi:hypothetical protein